MDSSKPLFDDTNPSGSTEGSSATGMFGTVGSAKPAAPPEDDLLKSLLRSSDAPAESTPFTPIPEPQSPAIAGRPASSEPGEFTQMFSALKPATPVQGNEPAPAAAAPVASPKAPADLTSVFTLVNLSKPPSPPAATPAPFQQPAAQKPGEFTQLLQTLNNPLIKPESAPPEAPKPTAEPGSFTQMFKAVTPATSLAETEPLLPTSPPAAQPSGPTTSGPGTFTQMFQTLSADTPPASKPEPPAAAGGFTQMFQALSSAPKEAPVAQPPIPASSAAVEQKAGPGAFTQMFQQIGSQGSPQADPLASLNHEPAPASSFTFTPTPEPSGSFFGSSTPSAPPSTPSPQQGGGFTQLFQALGKEDAAPAKEPPPLAPTAPPVSSGPPAAGGFTQLLRTLNTEPAPQASVTPQTMAPSPVPPTMPPTPSVSPSGPGEFTRIISGSMLREAQGQGTPLAPPTMPANAPAGGGQPAFQMPPAPGLPRIPAAAPPPIPQMPMHGGGQAPQMPHMQPPAFQFPQPPPPPAAQPPAPSKLQQYLPLILVLNVFVLIAVVLIVIFALRHH